MFPKLSAENLPKILHLVSGLQSIGSAHNATPAQVAIAWIVAQAAHLGVQMIAIPGAKQMKYVEENMRADTLRLSEEEISKIREWAEATVTGSRYPVGMESLGDVDTPPFQE